MYRVSLIGKHKYLGIILTAMQGLIIALLAVFLACEGYKDKWLEFGRRSDSIILYFEDMSDELAFELVSYLCDEADRDDFFIMRRDTMLAHDGNAEGFEFGIYGRIENKNLAAEYWGDEILSDEKLEMLLMADDPEATLGAKTGTAHMVADIPHIRFGSKVVFRKLLSIINESGTSLGMYFLIGVDGTDLNRILEHMTNMTGRLDDDFLISKHGMRIDAGLRTQIVTVFLGAQIVLCSVFFLIVILRNLNKTGKLALLGWTKRSICRRLYGTFILQTVAEMPLLVMFGFVMSGWNRLAIPCIGYFFSYSAVNVVLALLECLLSAMILFSMKSIDAIKERYPHRLLMVFCLIGYIGMSAGITVCGLYIDGPIKQMDNNKQLLNNWSNVEDFLILGNASVGGDEASFTGMSNQFNIDIWSWYKEISKEDGVYIINTEFYDESVLELWRNYEVYQSVPREEFWYYAFSPNYISELGIEIDKSIVEDAESGVRVFLIPEDMEQENADAMEAYLIESSKCNLNDNDIPTLFLQNQEFRFVRYAGNMPLFTWTSNIQNGINCEKPIIYVCTPENMTYFENESLRATGFDGYIKFKNQGIAEKALCNSLIVAYNLEDNELSFIKVKSYIDGLQKDLMDLIMWFGIAYLILTLILLGTLMALAMLLRIGSKDKLCVEKYMGYSFWKMYRLPVLLMLIVIITELLTVIFGRSNGGIIMICTSALLQIVIFMVYMSKNDIKSLTTNFKER